MWPDPLAGRRRTVWAFVMVLACSRHLFVWPTLRMDQQAWTEAHVEAFAFFNGVVRRLVPENVPRNIFRLLLPARLCGRRAESPLSLASCSAASAT
jgi:transposase